MHPNQSIIPGPHHFLFLERNFLVLSCRVAWRKHYSQLSIFNREWNMAIVLEGIVNLLNLLPLYRQKHRVTALVKPPINLYPQTVMEAVIITNSPPALKS